MITWCVRIGSYCNSLAHKLLQDILVWKVLNGIFSSANLHMWPTKNHASNTPQKRSGPSNASFGAVEMHWRCVCASPVASGCNWLEVGLVIQILPSLYKVEIVCRTEECTMLMEWYLTNPRSSNYCTAARRWLAEAATLLLGSWWRQSQCFSCSGRSFVLLGVYWYIALLTTFWQRGYVSRSQVFSQFSC